MRGALLHRGSEGPAAPVPRDVTGFPSLFSFSFLFSFSRPAAAPELPPVATAPSSVGVNPVAVVSVSTVTASAAPAQTMPQLLPQSLPAALPHSVAQPAPSIPTFPPVVVPPFRVPLPSMHIPLPGESALLAVVPGVPFSTSSVFSTCLCSPFYIPCFFPPIHCLVLITGHY